MESLESSLISRMEFLERNISARLSAVEKRMSAIETRMNVQLAVMVGMWVTLVAALVTIILRM